MDGFLFIDKEIGLTSFDVVRSVKKLFNEKKVGHSGTLDPLASGLMVLALGNATKLLEYLIGCDKEYEVLARFGAVSDTYDADGCIKNLNNDLKVSKDELVEISARKFLGEIFQMPPKYSALKVKGKRACDIMREGGDVALKTRKVHIKKFDILEYDWPEVRFLVKCSAGTYIRSLVHDLGRELLVGAYVKELRRTKINQFDVNDAVKLTVLNKKVEQGLALISLEKIARHFPVYHLSDQEYNAFAQGGIVYGIDMGFDPLMGFYKEKFVGVLEKTSKGVKLKKRI